MCIRDRLKTVLGEQAVVEFSNDRQDGALDRDHIGARLSMPVSYSHLRAHETVLDLVCRLLLEKKKRPQRVQTKSSTTVSNI